VSAIWGRRCTRKAFLNGNRIWWLRTVPFLLWELWFLVLWMPTSCMLLFSQAGPDRLRCCMLLIDWSCGRSPESWQSVSKTVVAGFHTLCCSILLHYAGLTLNMNKPPDLLAKQNNILTRSHKPQQA
jgi:hypothetical protein